MRDTGFVYVPAVPIKQTTKFGPEDFVPRKGVMTRYGKKMVREDMYGMVSLLPPEPPHIEQQEFVF